MCVYCNRDPEAPVVARAAAPPPPPPPASANPITASVLPKIRFAEQKFGGKVLMIVAALMLLIASFAVGGLYYAFGTKAPKDTEDTALLMDQQTPDAASDPTLRTGAPIVTSVPPGTYPVPTTAPVGTTIPSAMEAGADATALPADEYAKIAAQAQRTTTAPTTFQSVDPRTVTTPQPGIDAQAALAAQQQRSNAPPRRPSPSPSAATASTGGNYERPRPLSQPLPSFSEVRRNGTVRLSLTVGSDGRVEEVEVLESVPGITAKVISAVQRWKFKPATRNGEAVRGQFPVDITFKEHS